MNRILFFVWLIFLLLQSCAKPETISSQAQLSSDTTSIGSFLRSNNIQATKVNSGFWYTIDTVGNGIYPVLSDSVTIAYTTKLIPNLQEVDRSSLPPTLLSSTIAGLQQALILFPAGSHGYVYIPSGLAFGVNAHNNIPPNANLQYEIKLIGVNGTRLTNDIAAIDSYLQSHSIAARQDTISGIRYTIDETDTTAIRPKPIIADSILVTYTERILTADTLITLVNSPTKVALKDEIAGWRIMLPKYVAEGTTITMYIPSGYAYGSAVVSSIPANSNMEYIVTLGKVIHH